MSFDPPANVNVSIKQATQNALAFAREALGPERTAGARLEEVSSTKVSGKDAWVITLSMITKDPLESALGTAHSIQTLLAPQREYKSFTVRKSDGEVLAMKIREFADA